MVISLWTRLLDLISPHTCAVCGGRLSVTEEEICSVCNMHLPRTGFHKHPCDNPMARMFWGLIPIERATALFYYAPHSETSHLIYSLKYYARPDIGVALGRMAASELIGTGFFEGIDIIMPIPLASKRRRERGYNQSEEVAKGVSCITNIPIMTNIVERTRFNQSQTHLYRWERRENVVGVFRLLKAGERLSDKHILIVDDVVTTGSTITACADVFKNVEGVKFSVFALGYTKS